MRRVLLMTMWSLASAATALAAGVTIHVNLTADGAAECTIAVDEKGNAAAAKIQAAVSKEQTPISASDPAIKDLTFAVREKAATAETPLNASTGATQLVSLTGGPANLDDAKQGTYVVRNKKKALLCEVTPLAPAVGQPDQRCDLAGATKAARAYVKDRDRAGELIYAATQGLPPSEDWTGGRHLVVVLGPDGEPLSTLPSATERDSIDLVVIAPADAQVDWPADKIVCTPPPWYRVLSKAAPQAVAGTPKAGGPAVEMEPAPFWQGQVQSCADKLEYIVKVTLPNCSAVEYKRSLTTRAMYDFFIGGAFGYDFGSPVDLSSETRVVAGQTQTVLVRSRPQTGFKPVFTLTYFPFGMDPYRFRLWAVPGPFVAMDPTRISSGAIAGIDWTFPHGFGLLTGVSVFEGKHLVSPVGLNPGDVIPAGTSLQTKDVFNSDGVGFFLGANFPTELIQEFLSSAAKGFGAASTK